MTVVGSPAVKVHVVPIPVQAPAQPLKIEDGEGSAWIVIVVPSA